MNKTKFKEGWIYEDRQGVPYDIVEITDDEVFPIEAQPLKHCPDITYREYFTWSGHIYTDNTPSHYDLILDTGRPGY